MFWGWGGPCFATLSLWEATHGYKRQNPAAHIPWPEKPELYSGEGSHFWVTRCV